MDITKFAYYKELIEKESVRDTRRFFSNLKPEDEMVRSLTLRTRQMREMAQRDALHLTSEKQRHMVRLMEDSPQDDSQFRKRKPLSQAHVKVSLPDIESVYRRSDEVMYPVPPQVRRRIYMDPRMSHIKGREAYLKERYKLEPEEKFIHPFLSSWTIGWHSQYYADHATRSQFKRLDVVEPPVPLTPLADELRSS